MSSSHRYRAYGLTIASPLALPELAVAAGDGDADVTIATFDEPAAADDRYALEVTQAEICFANEALRLRAIGGTLLEVHAHDLADPAVRQYVVGPGLAMVLLQRGFTLLHASAVSIGGTGVAFAADSGVGKSTLAASLYARGHALLTDDLCAIADGVVVPAMSLLKIAERSVTATAAPGALIDVETEGERRLRFSVERVAEAAVPLRAVYLLEDGSDVSAERLGGSDAVLALVRHSYWQEFVDGGMRGVILKQSGALAREIRVFRLRRPRDLARIAEIAAWVERHSALL